MNDGYWMQQALVQAQKAFEQNEVPIGAVLVKDNQLIAVNFNQPISLNDPTAHAEILVLRDAGKKLNNYRLLDTTLYSTCEPCVMCVGALIHARIKRLVFAAYDHKAGAISSCIHLLEQKFFNHQLEWQGGVLEMEAKTLMQSFFKLKRRTLG